MRAFAIAMHAIRSLIWIPRNGIVLVRLSQCAEWNASHNENSGKKKLPQAPARSGSTFSSSIEVWMHLGQSNFSLHNIFKQSNFPTWICTSYRIGIYSIHIYRLTIHMDLHCWKCHINPASAYNISRIVSHIMILEVNSLIFSVFIGCQMVLTMIREHKQSIAKCWYFSSSTPELYFLSKKHF